ncbi:hypothetical protein BDW60DRAFT_177498 [Aspergillus nidulans var. acristatus]
MRCFGPRSTRLSYKLRNAGHQTANLPGSLSSSRGETPNGRSDIVGYNANAHITTTKSRHGVVYCRLSTPPDRKLRPRLQDIEYERSKDSIKQALNELAPPGIDPTEQNPS